MQKENTGLSIIGEVHDIIKYNDGRIEDIDRGHNLVVSSILPLISSFLKGNNPSGITYWAIGSGASSWDTTPVNPSLTDITLTSEIGRKAVTTANMKFLDASGNTSSNPTNKIEITVSFGTSECNGTWREFGLFGGVATSTLGSGTMINKKHHSVITKTDTMTIERHVIFSLSLV